MPQTRISDTQQDSMDAASARGTFDTAAGLVFPAVTLTGPDTATEGQEVLFTANGSEVTGWSFDAGDGSPVATTPGPWNHTYAAAGRYTARVTGKGANGSDSADHTTTVVAP